MKLVDKICTNIIEYSFLLLVLGVPLVFTQVNFELFEFNKMLLVYGLTAVILAGWVGRIIAQKKIIWQKSFWDIPLAIFLLSQFVSLIFSIDPHTSLFGYYSRFNGGVISLTCYAILYWALVANFDKNKIFRLLGTALLSTVIVSVYAALEHFGRSLSCLMITNKFDVDCWVQDVQNRVFATLGQPNWLAAYLVALTPLTWSMILNSKVKSQTSKQKFKIQNFLGIFLFCLFFITLLFTKSRSGLIGFGISYFVFWLLIIVNKIKASYPNVLTSPEFLPTIKSFLFFTLGLSLIVLYLGSPFTPSYQQIINKISGRQDRRMPPQETEVKQELISPQGGTESGEIRQIVWKGALQIWKQYPVLGTGPETFAYSYYWFRPREHNDISEWDFLYNKAHNEYLNYAATTGTVGLLTYLTLIGSFTIFCIKKLKAQSAKLKATAQNVKHKDLKKVFVNYSSSEARSLDTATNNNYLIFALLSGFVAICVSNFFGFSVVVVNLFFFLIPAVAVVLEQAKDNESAISRQTRGWQIVALAINFTVGTVLLLSLFNYWRADTYYSRAIKANKGGQTETALQFSNKAIQLWGWEPVYYDEMAVQASEMAFLAAKNNDGQKTSDMIDLALQANQLAIKTSPYHLNFWKNRTKVFFKLGEIDQKYYQSAYQSLVQANKLAPTDAKILYNLALIQYQLEQTVEAITTLQKAILLKPNYADARYALALFYEKTSQKEEARQQLRFILEKIDPNFELATQKLKSLDN